MPVRRTTGWTLPAILFCVVGACGDDEEGDADVAGDAEVDGDANDGAPAETDADAPEDGGGIPNEWGFDMRYPVNDRLSCSSASEPTVAWPDADWICSFSYGGVEAVVYVQASPVRCEEFMGPVLETRVAQVYLDGEVSPLTDTAYDWGGNHHNDALEFSFGGRHYRAFHSSIGFGWRACHPMDCLQVSDAAGTLIEDGCTCDRTVPAVCVQVRSDGTWDELIDTFEVCPGDSTCGG